MAALLVLVEGILLALQWAAAGRTSQPLASIFRSQAIFWGLAFVVVPTAMLLVTPPASFGDAFVDERIVAIGYEAGLTTVMWIVLAGQATFTALTWAYVRFRGTADIATPQNVTAAGLFLAFLVGVALRASWLAGIDSALLEALLPLGTVVSTIVLIYERQAGWPFRVLRVAVVVGEIVWSIEFASKTPVIAVAVALVIRFSWNANHRLKWWRITALGVLSLVGFFAIQTVKTEVSTRIEVAKAADTYPAVVGPAMPLLIRFDLAHAVADVAFLAPGSWIDAPEYLSRLWSEVVPRTVGSGKDDLTPGQRWAREVRAQTLGQPKTTVALAEGPIAEGYAVAGLVGVITLVSAVFTATIFTGFLLKRRSPFLLAWGASIISPPILFERGILGLAGGLVRGCEIAAVLLVIFWLAHSLTRSQSVHRGSHVERTSRVAESAGA